MQKNFRKNRNVQINGREGETAIAGFFSGRKNSSQVGLIIILTIFFESCSNLKTIRIPINKNIKRICLSGEGKGKLKYLNQLNTFSFESKLNLFQKTWSVVFHIPFGESEIIKLNYAKSDLVSRSAGKENEKLEKLNLQY